MKLYALATTLVIFAAVCFMQALADRHSQRLDMTRECAFTLSEATMRALSEVAEPIRITVFVPTSDAARTDIDGLLREVVRICPRISFRLTDPQMSPDLARELKITKSRIMVFQAANRLVKTRGCSELHLLSGLRRIMRTTRMRVHFLVGHGERDILSPQRDGARMFVEALILAGLEIAPLKLHEAARVIPKDCGAIVALAPQQDLLPKERDALMEFLGRGGGLLVFSEKIPGPNWEKIYHHFSLDFHKAVAVDPRLNMNGIAVDPIVADFRPHPVVRTLEAVVLHGARPLKQLRIKGVRHSALLFTSRQSWGETNPDSAPSFNEDEDIKPPLMMGCAAERTVKWRTKEEEVTARFLLIGDEDLVVNNAFRDLNNADLGIGAVEWVAGYGENVIMLPKTFMLRDVYFTPGQFRVIFAIAVLGIPLLTGACALLVQVMRQ